MIKTIEWESYEYKYDTLQNRIHADTDTEEDTSYEDARDAMDMDMDTLLTNEANSTLVQTPIGVFNVSDSMNPFKHYKFWLGHTNFNISPEVIRIIKNIPGVEVLRPISRYRFFIGIGKLFNLSDIQGIITKELIENPIESKIDLINNSEIEDRVISLINNCSQSYAEWMIYIFPNGEIDYIYKGQEDYQAWVEAYKQSFNISGGILIGSDDVNKNQKKKPITNKRTNI